EREVELGAGETLGRILELKVRPVGCLRERLDLPGGVDRDLGHALAVSLEDDLPLQRRSRVVEVDDDLLRALHGLERALDQLRAALGQHLDRNVVRNGAVLDNRADEVELGLRGGGKGDFDLLEAHAGEQAEHAVLAIDAHRLDQRLVAVAQVDRAPDRRLFDDPRGPLAIRQENGRIGAVLLNWHLSHDEPWRCGGAGRTEPAANGLKSCERSEASYASRRALERRANKSEGRRPHSHGTLSIRAG